MGNERRIVIDEVNVSQGFVTGQDAYGATLQVGFDFQGAIVTIPIQGELWIVEQYKGDWRLDRKAEQNPRVPLDTLSPGDKRLEASGDLYLSGRSVLVNEKPIASNNHGPAAELPPATSANANSFYYAVDTTILYFSTGTAWISITTP